MAKHIIGKKQSKGIRTSCYGNKKPAAKGVSGNLNTAIREAFLNTKITETMQFSRLGNIVIKAAQNEPRLSEDQKRGWSTKLSFRTFKALQAQGVLA